MPVACFLGRGKVHAHTNASGTDVGGCAFICAEIYMDATFKMCNRYKIGNLRVFVEISAFVCKKVQYTDFRKTKKLSKPTVLTNWDLSIMRMKKDFDDRYSREVRQ